MRAGLLLLLMLLASPFAASCEADVDDVYLDISVKEYIGQGVYVPVTEDTLDLYGYVGIFDHTRIYLAGFDSSDMCAPNCKDERPEEFTADMVVVSEYGGSYKVTEVFGLVEGEQSPTLTSEGRDFSFTVADFWSRLSCEEYEDEDYDYCLDGTRWRKCSYTLPYRCIKDDDDDLTLVYQPGFCGKPDWLVYSEGCAYGEILYCDAMSNSVMRKTCEGASWVTVMVEECGDRQCLFNSTYASCSELASNTCSDGTLRGGCSDDKPYYCNDKAVLIKSPKICGCPEDAVYEPTTLSCLYSSCDGTPVGECSGSYQCGEDGELVEKASFCGCPDGYSAQGEACVLIQENVTPTIVVISPEPADETEEEPAEDAPPVVVEHYGSVPQEQDEEGLSLEISLLLVFLAICAIAVYLFMR